MIEHGVKRDYVCIDTFTGFTREDVNFEYANRGKTNGMYDDIFIIRRSAVVGRVHEALWLSERNGAQGRRKEL